MILTYLKIKTFILSMKLSKYKIAHFNHPPLSRQVAIAQRLNAAAWPMVLDTLPDR
jgi:hypothetical protein